MARDEASNSAQRHRGGPPDRPGVDPTTYGRDYHLLLRAGLSAQDALQRPGEAVKGTGPESVRRRLITQRSHVRL